MVEINNDYSRHQKKRSRNCFPAKIDGSWNICQVRFRARADLRLIDPSQERRVERELFDRQRLRSGEAVPFPRFDGSIISPDHSLKLNRYRPLRADTRVEI